MSRRVIERIDRGFVAAIVSFAGALSASACSGDSAEGKATVGEGCTSGDCAGTGAACDADAECESGSCSGGVCIAEVGGVGPSMPSENGPPFILTEDFEPTAGAGAPVCVDLEVGFERVTPTVVLLVDRSGSMTQNFDNGLDRWETLVQTLTDPQSSLINELDSSVRFGMVLYTSNGGFGNGPTPRQCPVLTSVDISIGNFANMSALLTSSEPGGDTPTAESLEAIVAQLRAFGEAGPKSIVLATDGDPDTCEDPEAHDDDGSKARSVAAVTAARAEGIATHVISVGDEVAATHLKELAVAGAGGDAAAEAFTALDTEGLVNAFGQIIGSVRTCDFTLEATVAAADAPRGTVLVDGEALAFDDPNGWTMPDASTVRLQGEACEAIQADATGISMSFPCDAIDIIPR